jgi:hypothetical protein
MRMIARVALSLALLLNLSVTRADLDRAVQLARWPHTDAERAHFHDRYLFPLGSVPGPVATNPVAIQLEVITEFRRIELLVEEHDRIQDLFARGGTDDVVATMRPWREKVAIGVYLLLPGGNDASIPPAEIVVDGAGVQPAHLAARGAFHTSARLRGAFADCILDALFDAAVIGQTMRQVTVVVAGREAARTAIDFSALE